MPIPLFNTTLPSPDPPPPDTDADRCHLLGTTGLIVQASMGIMVLLSLVLKRQFERRKRPWKIWTWDVGKQLVGQGVIHGWNVLVSLLVADADDNNPCSLYFLNILLDCTFGVAIFFFSLKLLTWFIINKLGKEGFVSGQYGTPPQSKYWWGQLIPYLISIIFMKLMVLLPLTLPHISAGLIRFGQSMLGFLSPSVQVVFVMAIFPLIMNVLQFCIVDQVIKSGKQEDDEKDEEDGGGQYRRLPTGEAEEPADRRRLSGIKVGSVPTSPVPRSPLLEAGDARDYGSTSPTPSPSGETAEGSIWSALLKKREERQLGADSYQESSINLNAPRNERRSGAPSPESYRPHDHVSTIPSIDLTHTPEPSTPTEESNPPSLARFGHVSRLSDDLGREARRSLSPRNKASLSTMSETANLNSLRLEQRHTTET